MGLSNLLCAAHTAAKLVKHIRAISSNEPNICESQTFSGHFHSQTASRNLENIEELIYKIYKKVT